MKILVVSQYYYPEQFRINDICEELVIRGHDITVLTGLPNYPEGNIFPEYENWNQITEIINGVEIIRCKNRPRKTGAISLTLNYISFPYQAWKTIKTINKEFDLIFVYQLSPVFSALPAIKFQKKSKLPMILYCCDIWPESIRNIIKNKSNPIFKIVQLISSYIYKQADRLIVSSPSFVDYLERTCGVNNENMRYIPQHAEDSYLEMKLSARNSIVKFMFLGNIGRAQDCDKIIEAANLIKNPDLFEIHFVGEGSEFANIKKLAEESNLRNIVFHGRHPLSEMPDFYKIADVCLLTLSAETSVGLTIPSKLQGYMAAGKPVIAAIEGDAVTVITAARCGICVPPGNVAALAKAMEGYIKNPDEYSEYGENGREYFRLNFTKEKFLNTLETSLNEVAQLKTYT